MTGKTRHFVGTQFSFSYGVTIHQVWSVDTTRTNPGLKLTGFNHVNVLKYETTSKAKANAVCEYLNLKAEQDDLDQHRTPEIKGTVVPGSIKIS